MATISAVLLKQFDDEVELILVDNKGPEQEAIRRYVTKLAERHDNINLVCCGENLGCHGGWNYGFRIASGDFLVKLDDDTVVMTEKWLDKMSNALIQIPDLAFISADIDAKQNNKYNIREINGHKLEVPERGIVGFSCVMFRRDDIIRWGLMKTGAYRYAGAGNGPVEDRLYGGEEVYYANMAAKEGKYIAHYQNVFCHHLDNADRNPDFVFWKRAYGYYGWTNLCMDEWIETKQNIEHYCKAILLEASQPTPNDVLIRDWTKRIGEIGGNSELGLVEMIIRLTKNEDVKKTAEEAAKKLKGNCK